MQTVPLLHQPDQRSKGLVPVATALHRAVDDVLPKEPFALLKFSQQDETYQLVFIPNVKGDGVLPLYGPLDHLRRTHPFPLFRQHGHLDFTGGGEGHKESPSF